MRKDNIHFKIAAWSIKYPVYFYSIVVISISLLIGTVFFGLRVTSTNMAPPLVGVLARSNTAPTEWLVLNEKMYGDKKCITSKKLLNGTVLTSCYVFQNGKWVFEQSY